MDGHTRNQSTPVEQAGVLSSLHNYKHTKSMISSCGCSGASGSYVYPNLCARLCGFCSASGLTGRIFSQISANGLS